MTTSAEQDPPIGLERVAWLALLAFAASLQVSIGAAGILLTITAVLWLVLVIRNRERVEVPGMFWPLAAYAAVTLVSAMVADAKATGADETLVSLRDTKQLVLFAIVPIAYRLLPGRRSLTAVDVIITIGAIEAVFGIVQYAILNFDSLQRRVQGSLTHYMTYSGVLMLVACTAAARIMFRKQDRTWASLVMPALLVAIALTMSRNAWVGVCVGIGLLLLLRDFRLVALLPVAAAVFLALAPAPLTERLYSTFSLKDPTNRDRIAMMKTGVRIIKDYPLTGVGPDRIRLVYAEYRDPSAVRPLNPHLHNVPFQIAAERGLPALGIWLWFIVVLIRDLIRKTRSSSLRSLPTAALAGVVAMLAAGMFEYNFGDSEFLMLFLLIVTLPYAGDRLPASTAPAVAQRHAA
jgi:O-antigen ligase